MIRTTVSRPPLLVAVLPAGGSRDSTAKVAVVVNGTPTAVTGTLSADTVAVPLGSVLEALGLQAEWTGADGKALIKGGANELAIQVGSATATAKHGEVAVTPAPRLVGGRLVVPLQPVAMALGIEVDWQPTGQTLHLQRAGTPAAALATSPAQRPAAVAPMQAPAGAAPTQAAPVQAPASATPTRAVTTGAASAQAPMAAAPMQAPASAPPAQAPMAVAPVQAPASAAPAQAAPTRAPSMFWAPGAGVSSVRPTQAAPASAPVQQPEVAGVPLEAAAPLQTATPAQATPTGPAPAQAPSVAAAPAAAQAGTESITQAMAAETLAAQTLASPETLAAQVGAGVPDLAAAPAQVQSALPEVEKEAPTAGPEAEKEAEAEAPTATEPPAPVAQIPHWTAPAATPPGPPKIQWARPAAAPTAAPAGAPAEKPAEMPAAVPAEKPAEVWNPPLATAPPRKMSPVGPQKAAPPDPPAAPSPPTPTTAPTAPTAPAQPTATGAWPTPPTCQMKATVETKQIREDTPDLVTDIQFPQVSDIPQVPAGKINGVLYDWAEKARRAGQQAVASAGSGGSPIRPFQDYGRYDVGYNEYGLFSLYLDNYIFAGGAHGMTYRTPFTFDLNTGHNYGIQELFRPNVNYVSLLSQEIKRQMDERGLTQSLLQPFNAIKPDQKYYIRDGNLVIFFDLYEYFPYAWGFQEFPIPLASLRPYLRPEFAVIPWEKPCP